MSWLILTLDCWAKAISLCLPSLCLVSALLSFSTAVSLSSDSSTDNLDSVPSWLNVRASSRLSSKDDSDLCLMLEAFSSKSWFDFLSVFLLGRLSCPVSTETRMFLSTESWLQSDLHSFFFIVPGREELLGMWRGLLAISRSWTLLLCCISLRELCIRLEIVNLLGLVNCTVCSTGGLDDRGVVGGESWIDCSTGGLDDRGVVGGESWIDCSTGGLDDRGVVGGESWIDSWGGSLEGGSVIGSWSVLLSALSKWVAEVSPMLDALSSVLHFLHALWITLTAVNLECINTLIKTARVWMRLNSPLD